MFELELEFKDGDTKSTFEGWLAGLLSFNNPVKLELENETLLNDGIPEFLK